MSSDLRRERRLQAIGHIGRLTRSAGALLFALALVACTTSIPNDGGGATLERYEQTRGGRFTEVFMIGGTPLLRDLHGNVYNTYGLNDMEHTGDSCPDAMLAKVDVEEQSKLFGVLGIFVNGPRLWTPDWIELPVGVRRTFGGLKATWVGKVDLSGVNLNDPEATAYKPRTTERWTQFGFRGGTPIFILDDAKGRSWVMSSASLMVDRRQNLEQLAQLGGRLKPALGWTFRVRVVDQDLILRPEKGIAGIVQDELGNSYDLTGPGYSNYKP